MVISEANLDFCGTMVGWALPEITLSRLYFPYMRNTFSSRAFVRLQLHSASVPCHPSRYPTHLARDAAQTTKPVPKPHIYITIGVPMPGNSHDALKERRELPGK